MQITDHTQHRRALRRFVSDKSNRGLLRIEMPTVPKMSCSDAALLIFEARLSHGQYRTVASAVNQLLD